MQLRLDSSKGQRAYQSLRDKWRADPEYQAIYEEEAARGDLWLQLIDALQTSGLTEVELAKRPGVSQTQATRIAKRGYDFYSLGTLRRYIRNFRDMSPKGTP
jgi:hypothetical protein